LTEKLINVAVFWLPLLAGIILSGLGPSIWYNGDKIAALWVGFFGVMLLLLTGIVQIQAYIQATILQPNFEVASQQKSLLAWGNSPYPNLLNVRGEKDDIPAGNWNAPIFTIRNKTPVNAQDVRITWSAPKYDLTAVTSSNASNLDGHQVTISQDNFVLATPGMANGNNPFSFSVTIEKPFITRSAETFIPLSVWNTAALYFISTLPSEPGGRSEAYYFDLAIAWSIPENGKPSRFRIKAVATNTKPAGATSPFLSATIEFLVEPED